MRIILNPRKDHLNDLTRALTGSTSLPSALWVINNAMRELGYMENSGPEIDCIASDLQYLKNELLGDQQDRKVMRQLMMRLYHNTSLAMANPHFENSLPLQNILKMMARATRMLRQAA